MNSDQILNTKKGAAASRQPIQMRQPAHVAPKPAMKELADLLGELHELLEGYAPPWYTEQLDTRLKKALGTTRGFSSQTAQQR